MKTNNSEQISFKASLLSSTFLIAGISATNTLLPDLQKAFPAIAKPIVQSFISLPALPQFIFLVLAPLIAHKIGKRNTILVGSTLWTIAGIVPMFLNNFCAILISRLFLGASLGLIQPIGTALISDYYSGEAKDSMLGIQSAVIGISGTILTYTIGVLLNTGWKNAFYIYLIGIVVFILTITKLPDDREEFQTEETGAKNEQSRKLGRDIIWWICLTLFFNLGQGGINFEFNLAVVESGISNASGAANMMVAYSILGLITGLFFGLYMKVFKSYGGVIAGTLFFMGNLLVATTNSVISYYVAMIFAGAGFGLFMPYMFSSVSKHATAKNSAFAMSATTAAASAGNFIAPYVYAGLAKIFGNTTSKFAFWFSAFFSLILVIGLVYLMISDKKQVQTE